MEIRKKFVELLENVVSTNSLLATTTLTCWLSLLKDESTAVVKTALNSLNFLLNSLLGCFCQAEWDEALAVEFSRLLEVQREVTRCGKSANDGVRTVAVKFIQLWVLYISDSPSDGSADPLYRSYSAQLLSCGAKKGLTVAHLRVESLLQYLLDLGDVEDDKPHMTTAVVALNCLVKCSLVGCLVGCDR